jgi:hypothetical protein
MENVSHNTSYSEGWSPNVHNEDEELEEESGNYSF